MLDWFATILIRDDDFKMKAYELPVTLSEDGKLDGYLPGWPQNCRAARQYG